MKTLGGWQRLGIVLTTVWWLGIAAVVCYDFAKHREGSFTSLGLPPGTVVLDGRATLPDGRTVQLDLSVGGQSVKPWEIKWDNESAIPTAVSVRWQRIAYAGLLPVGLWLLLVIASRAFRWVRAGFRAGAT